MKIVSRRGFLAALGSLAAAPVFSGSTLAASPLNRASADGAPLFASAYRKAGGEYGVGIVDELGQMLAQISLPGRGHGIAVARDGSRFVAFARRPGTFAVVVRPFEDAQPELITSDPGRHFYGHGCFSADGRLLYAVENDFAAARGVVGIYDMSGGATRRIGEFETNGIGPHDILLGPDSRTLIVANGGIETHPDKGREKLNLETMAPSVVFMDSHTGDILAQHGLEKDLHQLSLRHMALDAEGRVWVGGQFEGSPDDVPPLIGIFSQDAAPDLTVIPDPVASGLQNYIGSVAANAGGEVIATSAPRGGQTLFWSASSGAYLGTRSIPDGCGIARIDRGSFLVSDGNGALSLVTDPADPAEVLARPPGISWDNHLFNLAKIDAA
ncbi:DUF1513 domain-containing protein [Labrenzia sp. OB1]|uniref:DUF1513 domain-containing protein n=1 Tax=Labrenzia sp. OB1 TaxID=1561204 RepID=UPI0007B23983|nr:DUF1513 domain-containing protein [Labrenzia sp. OB1]KZM51060.1 Twin-arginine translocation pathway signal [Labrenzia sp. OB1]